VADHEAVSRGPQFERHAELTEALRGYYTPLFQKNRRGDLLMGLFLFRSGGLERVGFSTRLEQSFADVHRDSRLSLGCRQVSAAS
jgi:hypothetical protein